MPSKLKQAGTPKVMSTFAHQYTKYIETLANDANPFGIDLKSLEKIEPLLAFLFKLWWRVDLTGLQFLPETGPALIVGNSGSALPWPGLMLAYAFMSSQTAARPVSILCDMGWITDERIYEFLTSIGFVPWSSENAKKVFAAGHIAVTFPEGAAGLSKTFSERYRLRSFDWTRLLPAVEEHVPIYPMSTLGCDEAVPVLANWKVIADLANLPEFPVTPFFPWLPFPASLLSLPVKWRMRILKQRQFTVKGTRDDIIDLAQQQTSFTEGEIQAELNRLLRQRIKTPR